MSEILITGAAGRIGTMLRERLPGYGWTVRGLDRVPLEGGGGLVGEVTDPEIMATAVAGVEAVVHLAGYPSEAAWPTIRDINIEGTFATFEAARRHGVRRVIFASSNHAVGFAPQSDNLPADTEFRPDTLYGVSKVFGEALGRYYADRYGMDVVCLRIGSCGPRPFDTRTLGTWLSPDDCGRLVDAALRAPDVGFRLVWGVSANRRNQWSQAAGEAIGYHPQDDGEVYAGEVKDGPDYDLVGGRFTTDSFDLDYFD